MHLNGVSHVKKRVQILPFQLPNTTPHYAVDRNITYGFSVTQTKIKWKVEPMDRKPTFVFSDLCDRENSSVWLFSSWTRSFIDYTSTIFFLATALVSSSLSPFRFSLIPPCSVLVMTLSLRRRVSGLSQIKSLLVVLFSGNYRGDTGDIFLFQPTPPAPSLFNEIRRLLNVRF